MDLQLNREKLAIMQPYLFPYIGYFQLMEKVNLWVVFDTVKFNRKGWMNRNRLLHPDATKGWNYFSIPVQKADLKAPLFEIKVDNSSDWAKSFLGKLTSFRHAPYYLETIQFLESWICSCSDNLSDAVVQSILMLNRLLEINTPVKVASKMPEFDNIEIDINHAGEWAPVISARLGFGVYINAPGGREIFHQKDFASRNVELFFWILILNVINKRPEILLGVFQ